MTLSRTRGAAEYRETLRSVLWQTEHMSWLVADLLTLARADAVTLPLRRETHDLAQMARDVAAQLQPLAASRAICLELDTPATLPVLADEDRLLQVLLNLLDNALRHTGDGGTIGLVCRAEGEQAVIVVQDAGHRRGAPAAHLRPLLSRRHAAEPQEGRRGAGPRDRAHPGRGPRRQRRGPEPRGGRHGLYRAASEMLSISPASPPVSW